VPDEPNQPDPFEILGLDADADDDRGGGGGPGPVDPAAAPMADHDDAGYDDGDDYIDVRGAGRSGGRRWGLVVLGVLAALLVVVGAGAWWVRGQVNPGNPGEEVALTIPSGSTSSDVAQLLADKSIVTNATVFEWYLRFTGGGDFQAGEYEGLRVNSDMGEVVKVLDAGPIPPRDVTFLVREGLWESETRQLILDTFPGMDPAALDDALATTHPPLQPAGSSNLDGFLFPATYEVPVAQVDDPAALVGQMVDAFGRVATDVGLAEAPVKLQGELGGRTITPYEALIVASLVEAEAKVPEDRAKIARVIYNRLAAGMTLGIDATVLYALQERTDTLTNTDLQTDSPYNTRQRAGLPPTPINSPGQASLEAALNPEPGDWLYYVLTDAEGRHYFTDSYSDFQRAVADARDRGVF
jgi:UPF0755 protein